MLKLLLQSAAALIMSLTQPSGDAIPDFSTVGYHHSDDGIPSVPVVKTLTAPSDGSDALALVQEAINTMTGPGAILLKSGTWHFSSTIMIRKSGIVLRGEGSGTRLIAEFTKQNSLIKIGDPSIKRNLDKDSALEISDGYTPVGQMWVRAKGAGKFSVGDRVCIFRPGTENWIQDLRMDVIPARGKGTQQWKANEYNLYFEREVTAVKGDRIWLDAPIVMALDKKYGGGKIMKCSTARISECGVENMILESVFDHDKKDKMGRWEDEEHAWDGVWLCNCENCWVKSVTSRYFGYGVIYLGKGCRCCTVEDCHVEMPVSIVTGGRRYGLNMSGCELCLVRDCSVDNDRHGCVTGSRTCGPNVFLRCTGTNMWSDFGPHHRWSTGVLYDNVKTDGALNAQDRGNWGSGHGWAGANFIFWNCEARSVVCQNPWVSAQNWAVGCTGKIESHTGKDGKTFTNSSRSHEDGLQRPEGVFLSHGRHVEPESLYEYQLSIRKNK